MEKKTPKRAPRKPKIVPEDPCLLDTLGLKSEDVPRAYLSGVPRNQVIGIDLSATSTGLACSGGTHTVKSSGKAGASVSEWADRIDDIKSEVCDWVSWHLARERSGELTMLKFAVIEGPSYGHGREPYAHERAGLYWAVVMDLKRRGITVYTVPPKSMKKVLSGNGKADKDEQVRNSRKYFPEFVIRNDDEADALGLMAIGIYWTGQGIPCRMSPSRFKAESIIEPPWKRVVQQKDTTKKKKVAKCDGSKAVRTRKKTKETKTV